MIKFNPIDIEKDKQYLNIFVVGRPGKGQKFYLDENGNKVDDKVEDKVEEDE